MENTFQPVQFGRYLLAERIAIGGMAEIFLAKVSGAMGFEKSVVIKRILPQYVDDTDFLRMFITEAKLVCYLDHPNIVQVQELGEVKGQYYIAMEFVNGIDGRQLWRTLAKRKQRLPGVLSLFIVSEFLKGLDYAHRAMGPDGKLLGVVHRDVSPSNILISYRGDVKIVDFGIALVEHENKTKGGVLKGKYGYMSPEQVHGIKVDHRSDIFSAGIVLAELLLGRRLFMGRNDFETLDNVMNARLDVLDRSEKALPPDVVKIVRKSLTRDYNARYQSAREFHDDILELLYKQGERISNETLAAFIGQHVIPYLKRRSRSETSASGRSASPNIRSPVLPGRIVPNEQDLTPAPFSVEEKAEPAAAPPIVDSKTPTMEAEVVKSEHLGGQAAPDPGGPEMTHDPRYGKMPIFDLDGDDQDDELPLAEVPKPRAVTPGPTVTIDSTPSIRVQDLPDDDMELDLDDMDVEEDDPNGPPRKRPSVLVKSVLPSAEERTGEGEPDFSGQLAERTVVKVLFRFSRVKESGLLALTGPEPTGAHGEAIRWLHDLRKKVGAAWEVSSAAGRTAEIQLTDGKPDLAAADRSESGLVAYLLATGELTRKNVQLAVLEHTGRKLVAALLSAGLLAPLQISRHVSSFVMASVFDTFAWNEGSFAFYRGKTCTSEAFLTDLDPFEMVVKGIGTLNEPMLDAYIEKVGSRTVSPNRKPPVSIKAFSPDDTLLNVYRSTGASLTVKETVDRDLKFGLPLRVKQAMYLLLECDLALLK